MEQLSVAEPKRGGILGLRDRMEQATPVGKTLRWAGERVHPIRITALRLPLTLGAVGLQSISRGAATTIYAISTLLDWVDGAAARATHRESIAGAKLDPLVDKLGNGTALAVAALQHSDNRLLLGAALASIGVDILSQLQRGPIPAQIRESVRAVLDPEAAATSEGNMERIRANTLGKVKMILQSMCIGTLMAMGGEENVQDAAAYGLFASATLGLLGTAKRAGGGAWNGMRRFFGRRSAS